MWIFFLLAAAGAVYVLTKKDDGTGSGGPRDTGSGGSGSGGAGSRPPCPTTREVDEAIARFKTGSMTAGGAAALAKTWETMLCPAMAAKMRAAIREVVPCPTPAQFSEALAMIDAGTLTLEAAEAMAKSYEASGCVEQTTKLRGVIQMLAGLKAMGMPPPGTPLVFGDPGFGSAPTCPTDAEVNTAIAGRWNGTLTALGAGALINAWEALGCTDAVTKLKAGGLKAPDPSDYPFYEDGVMSDPTYFGKPAEKPGTVTMLTGWPAVQAMPAEVFAEVYPAVSKVNYYAGACYPAYSCSSAEIVEAWKFVQSYKTGGLGGLTEAQRDAAVDELKTVAVSMASKGL